MEIGSEADKEESYNAASRRQLLLLLQARLQQLRADLARVRQETQLLLDVAGVRSLGREEAVRSTALQRELDRLRWELRRLFVAFDDLRR